ncbi:hypothetical protein KUTeg_022050 [Tegillarca granosa]|uniref:Uncharacterized protein n=1 Tax=Tegillarca granosa TaxID=220873 RepID=A0ABQ9E538_TEGGR|nr:hypothetical protein KUTeg_022050 [Tegillarca granosa]
MRSDVNLLEYQPPFIISTVKIVQAEYLVNIYLFEPPFDAKGGHNIFVFIIYTDLSSFICDCLTGWSTLGSSISWSRLDCLS